MFVKYVHTKSDLAVEPASIKELIEFLLINSKRLSQFLV